MGFVNFTDLTDIQKQQVRKLRKDTPDEVLKLAAHWVRPDGRIAHRGMILLPRSPAMFKPAKPERRAAARTNRSDRCTSSK